MPTKPATLYLMPTWLGDAGGVEQLPPENLVHAALIKLWFAEHEKSARHALRRMVPGVALDALEIHRLDKDSTDDDVRTMLARLNEVGEGAIISEAGMPGIADPGAQLVRAAHTAGINVVPLIGPSSLLLALAASGLNGQRFAFHGYLPRESDARRKAIKVLEQDARRDGAAQVFIETPYRNKAMLAELLRSCAPDTLLTLAMDITQPGGRVLTKRISEWKRAAVEPGERPTVFIIGH